jgi:DNA-directed RNA polymerase subunit E'/Rpb7
MFQELLLKHIVRVHPLNLSFGIRDTIDQELRLHVEGSITAQNAMVIRVTSVERVGMGAVSQRSGFGLFDVSYKAIVCAPRRDMVLDAVITRITTQGLHAEAGPLELFVAKPNLPPGVYTFRPEADAFVSTGDDPPLRPSTIVRIRIISTLPNAERTRLTGTASMKGVGLGPIGTRRF